MLTLLAAGATVKLEGDGVEIAVDAKPAHAGMDSAVDSAKKAASQQADLLKLSKWHPTYIQNVARVAGLKDLLAILIEVPCHIHHIRQVKVNITSCGNGIIVMVPRSSAVSDLAQAMQAVGSFKLVKYGMNPSSDATAIMGALEEPLSEHHENRGDTIWDATKIKLKAKVKVETPEWRLIKMRDQSIGLLVLMDMPSARDYAAVDNGGFVVVCDEKSNNGMAAF